MHTSDFIDHAKVATILPVTSAFVGTFLTPFRVLTSVAYGVSPRAVRLVGRRFDGVLHGVLAGDSSIRFEPYWYNTILQAA